MKHDELLEQSMKLLEEAFKQSGVISPEKPSKVEQVKEEISDDEVDNIMNKAAEKKFGKDSAQAKLHKKFGKKKTKKAEQDLADKQAKKDSESL